nr:DUF1016 N-terminal domain-containing protein [Rhodococcus sp. DMU1]
MLPLRYRCGTTELLEWGATLASTVSAVVQGEAFPDDVHRALGRRVAESSRPLFAFRRPRLRATQVVNTKLLLLYWDLGRTIAERQQTQTWGTKLVDRLASDLRVAFPQMRGLSRSHLFYMCQMALLGPRSAIVPHECSFVSGGGSPRSSCQAPRRHFVEHASVPNRRARPAWHVDSGPARRPGTQYSSAD